MEKVHLSPEAPTLRSVMQAILEESLNVEVPFTPTQVTTAETGAVTLSHDVIGHDDTFNGTWC